MTNNPGSNGARKAFSVNFSDLSGPLNPTGILSPAYLRLKLALDHNDTPDNVLQALYDWLSEKKIPPTTVDKILDLPSAAHAYEALVQMIGGKLSPQTIPPAARQTLQRAIQATAQRQITSQEQGLETARARLARLKGQFDAGESAVHLVRRMLGS